MAASIRWFSDLIGNLCFVSHLVTYQLRNMSFRWPSREVFCQSRLKLFHFGWTSSECFHPSMAICGLTDFPMNASSPFVIHLFCSTSNTPLARLGRCHWMGWGMRELNIDNVAMIPPRIQMVIFWITKFIDFWHSECRGEDSRLSRRQQSPFSALDRRRCLANNRQCAYL